MVDVLAVTALDLTCRDHLAAYFQALGVVAVGAAEPPVTLARTLLVEILANAIVPVVVIGPPVKPVPVAIFVTVPVPETVAHDGLAAAPPVVKTCPDVPGAKAVHIVPLR